MSLSIVMSAINAGTGKILVGVVGGFAYEGQATYVAPTQVVTIVDDAGASIFLDAANVVAAKAV